MMMVAAIFWPLYSSRLRLFSKRQDEGDGDVPKAFVIRKPGVETTAEAIVKGVAEKVAKYKQLRGGVVFVEALPRSLAGKLLRKELRKA